MPDPVQSTDVEYTVEGTTMVGRLALPAGDGLRPAVLIAHDGGGLDEYQKARAERFAELGYVAFAMDYYGHGRSVSDDDAAARCLALWSEPERIRESATAAFDLLRTQPRVDTERVGAVGYCFGGAFVLELARAGADVKGVVGFHPRLATRRPADAANIRGAVLVCVGADDRLISVEERIAFEEQMRAGGADWQLHLYGGVKHSFTRPGVERTRGPDNEYNERADRRSWRAMLELFDDVFVPAAGK